MFWPKLTFPPINLWSAPKMDSPCQQKCLYNTEADMCMSCGRTIDDIQNWMRLTDEEREQRAQEAEDRIRYRGCRT